MCLHAAAAAGCVWGGPAGCTGYLKKKGSTFWQRRWFKTVRERRKPCGAVFACVLVRFGAHAVWPIYAASPRHPQRTPHDSQANYYLNYYSSSDEKQLGATIDLREVQSISLSSSKGSQVRYLACTHHTCRACGPELSDGGDYGSLAAASPPNRRRARSRW